MVTQLVRYNLLNEAREAITPMLQRVLVYEWYTPANEPKGSSGSKGEAGVLWTAIVQLTEKMKQENKMEVNPL